MRLSRDAFWLLVGLLALAAWDAVGIDLVISRHFGGAGGFPWREQWLASSVLHDGARSLAWLLFAALLVGLWRPLPFAQRLAHSDRVAWLATTIACLAVVALLKRFSLTSCPWSLAEFGGSARHVSHWAFGIGDGGPGHCFPAGHANAAFCFLPGYFFLRRRAPVAARRWLLATLVAGAGFGATQVVRGAHFVSHALWTGWWCWAVCVAAIACRSAWQKRHPPIGALATASRQ